MQSSNSTIHVIRDWSDGFIALKHHAEDLCGAVESDLQAGERQRWPRTSGADVLLVAAFLEPSVRSLVARGDHGSASLARCWRACLQDLERWAVVFPSDEYLDNRRFWSDVLTATVHLSAASARVPTQREWDALISAVGAPVRNGIPQDVPFGPFANVGDFGDVFVAQRKHLMTLRGVDRLPPEPGMTGGIMPIPRTTYADLMPLATFWGAQLKAAKEIAGKEAINRQWNAAVTELGALIKTASPDAVYPKNQAFWRALSRVSTHVNIADGAPSKTERILDSIAVGVKQAPATIASAASAAAKGTAEVVGDVAGGAGKLAGSLLGGLFSGIGGPLVVGGGALGAYLLLRGRRARGEA